MTFFNRNRNVVLGIMVLPVTLALVNLIILVMGLLMARYCRKILLFHNFSKRRMMVFHVVSENDVCLRSKKF